MKKSLLLILFTLMVVVGCKESTTGPPPDVNSADYFPSANGNYYYYNIVVSDSTGSQSGTRKSYFNGDTTLLLTPYQIRVDTFLLNSNQSIISSYFRKSPTGIFNYIGIDTTGFSGLVPDSLLSGYSFSSEYRLIYQPLSLNQTWPVYIVRADLIYIEFDLFTIDAVVISKDTITFSYRNSTVTKEVYKIKYEAILVTGLNSPPLKYEAFSWIADGIGITRWEGDSELINFFAGVNIYPLNSIVIEELNSFKIN
jgi:hypothetical protein